jgi:hypothetical protein
MLTVGHFGKECERVSRKWSYCVHCKFCDIMIVVCWQLDTVQESERVSRKWSYCVHCKLRDIMIVVYWQLDTLDRSVSGSAGSDSTVYTVNCVTLRLLYVGSWTLCAGVWAGQQEMIILFTLWIVWHYDYCVLTFGHFVQECDWVSRKWQYCVHCKLCDILIFVCWQLDTLCRSVSGLSGSDRIMYTVNCVTLWLFYVGSWTLCAGVWAGQQEMFILCTL